LGIAIKPGSDIDKTDDMTGAELNAITEIVDNKHAVSAAERKLINMFVLQDWVKNVGCKMQSILLSGFRAPDQNTVAVKECVRWLRAQCQVDADPGKQSYMKSITMSRELIDAAMDELEYCPVHYVHHLADSFAVLAYHSRDEHVQELAIYLHNEVAVELFHFVPETREQFLTRHKDKFGSE